MARQRNKRVMIGLLAVMVIAVLVAVIAVIVYLSSGDEDPKSKVEEFSPVFDVQLALNQTWDPNYGNPATPEFQQLRDQLILEMDKVFKATMNNAGEQYNYTEVISFTNGSVMCDARTHWKKNRHVHKDKVGITTTEINEVLIYHTMTEAIKTAADDPSSFTLLSTAIGRSLSVTSVDRGVSETTTTTTTTTTTIPTTMMTKTSSPPMITTTQQKAQTTTQTTTTQRTTTLPPSDLCQNETLIVQQALPCLSPSLQDLQNSQSQSEFCRVLEVIGDCIIQGIKRVTSIQCSSDDKYNAVRKYKSELETIFSVYSIQYKIDECLPP